ncbi:NAD(P)-dependent alcohol dehydrogenase [Mumia sp. DW29H23]|uniref:NAD(P)-dependent alcohol dehydrogenase n=1 Tax=Mumia sp. DW29H23 TaxID=3421241 RepID=UPI003D69B68D
MKAVVQHEYGGTDRWEVGDVPEPVPDRDQVLVRVHAAGVDRGVWHVMTGLPLAGRLAFGLRRPKQPVVGMDLAGVVEAVGPDVTRFAVGDPVLGAGTGTFAELALAREKHLVAKPAGLSYEEAAALPVSALTALHGLRDTGRVQKGQRVLIVGASGGVGTYAVQLARAFGAEVAGVCRTSKVEGVRALGADPVVDYTREDPLDLGPRFDLVLDIGGDRSLGQLRRMLVPGGTLVLVGGEGGGRLIGSLRRSLAAVLVSPFVKQRLAMFLSLTKAEDLQLLADMAERGEIRPVVARAYPLDAAREALDALVAGDVLGKAVVTVR